ncbi:response regulator [Pontiella sp.]|uniref:response regulator n=1 Tax=Pontiella sp. TaxID=2837462 RepID=UPI00356740C6
MMGRDESGPIRVLLVDDEQAIRDCLVAYLDDVGFDAMACGSAEDARDLMRVESFQVCIVDLRLPGLGGEELILWAHKHFPEQRYIIHTGAIAFTLSDDLKAIGMKLEHVFLKPVIRLVHLTACIKELAYTPEAQRPSSKFSASDRH